MFTEVCICLCLFRRKRSTSIALCTIQTKHPILEALAAPQLHNLAPFGGPEPLASPSKAYDAKNREVKSGDSSPLSFSLPPLKRQRAVSYVQIWVVWFSQPRFLFLPALGEINTHFHLLPSEGTGHSSAARRNTSPFWESPHRAGRGRGRGRSDMRRGE